MSDMEEGGETTPPYHAEIGREGPIQALLLGAAQTLLMLENRPSLKATPLRHCRGSRVACAGSRFSHLRSVHAW